MALYHTQDLPNKNGNGEDDENYTNLSPNDFRWPRDKSWRGHLNSFDNSLNMIWGMSLQLQYLRQGKELCQKKKKKKIANLLQDSLDQTVARIDRIFKFVICNTIYVTSRKGQFIMRCLALTHPPLIVKRYFDTLLALHKSTCILSFIVTTKFN